MKRRPAIVYLIISAILWSTAGLIIKKVPWNPIVLSGFRSGIAAAVLLIFWYAKYKVRLPLPNKNVIFGAVSYAVLVTLFVTANKMTTSANAILLQYSAPVWLLLISRFFYKEKVSRRDIITVVVVLAGMTLFFVEKLEFGGTAGNLLAILSGVFMAVMILSLNKLKVRKPIEIAIWGNILTFIIGIPFSGGLTWTLSAVEGILFLGILQLGISYIFYTSGIQHVTALEGILIPILEPLLNPVWVFIGVGEKPSLPAIIGGVVVITAVVTRSILFERSRRKQEISI